MNILLAPIILVACGLMALIAWRWQRVSTALGVLGPIAAAVVGGVQVARVLAGGDAMTLSLPWTLPVGSFAVALDPLSAIFAAAVLVLTAAAALYGGGYMRSHAGKRSLGPHWFFYGLLCAGMLMVLLARDSVLFLIAWEVMSLAAFFLVMFDSSEESVRHAGWTYLVATHIGTAFLLVMFMLMGQGTSTVFGAANQLAQMPAETRNVLFILALVGFGTKAGFMPLHVWLPEAHAAAPSHVSAVMSGVMIKTGIYGLLRMLTLLGTPPAWWGWTLLIVGAVSGVMGILMSLTQHDLKRVLAYSSVENIGIIGMGLGLWLIGESYHNVALSQLGLAGAMLHVINHAMFKGMLFLAAGAVLHGTGTRILDLLGGLGKRMPWTAGVFALGAVAICGLPPLNGFMGEFLLYFGCYGGTLSGGATAAASLVVIASLALIGGLALASFTRAFGIIFLGAPRTEHATHAHEAGLSMKAAMVFLATACVTLALAAPGIAMWMGGETLTAAALLLTKVLAVSALFLLLFVLLAALRGFLLRGRSVEQAGTWDCGYAEPNARIQYTASSFAQPITALMQIFHRGRTVVHAPQGLFPAAASMETRTPDLFTEGVFRPVFAAVAWVVARLRWLQHGRIQLYVLYIALAVLALMVWKLG